jgi:isopenicillin N synthase-like dioxygenase
MTGSNPPSIPELTLADYLHASAERRAVFEDELMRGLKRHGFILLRDHTVAAPLLERAYQLTAAFFSQGETVKRRYIGGARGYAPFGVEHARDQMAPDLKEFWQVGADGNVWPQWPVGFAATFTALFDALQETGRLLLEALTPGLGLPRNFFDAWLTQRNSVLRLLHYPPIPADAAGGSLRSAPHEDINLLTLLPAPAAAGLEIQDRDGTWLPVRSQTHQLIVDSGDMLQRMTNDVIPATTHRVVNPTDANLSRYSMPFFIHPNPEVVLRCVESCLGAGSRYVDMTAGAFLEQRLVEIGLLSRPT